MSSSGKLNLAVVGLRFGRRHFESFAVHPDVGEVGICDTNEKLVTGVKNQFPRARVYSSLEDVLASTNPVYDAVALYTPIELHAKHVLQVLAAGRHVACAVPMAWSVDDMRAIIAARRQANRTYMMMETQLFCPETLWALETQAAGEFGDIQFLRGGFHWNTENNSRYWHGMPPMHYISHPLSALLKLAGKPAVRVTCMGTGKMRPQMQEVYHQPYPCEVALFQLQDSPVCINISSMSTEMAHVNREWYEIIGSKRSFYWKDAPDSEHLLVYRHPYVPGGTISVPTTNFRFSAALRLDLLPEALRRPGVTGHVDAAIPHLAHQFVRAALENRPSPIDVIEAASISAPGLFAHQSALQGGMPVDIPVFE